MHDTSQTTLLRIAAFLVDALSIAIVLIVPASLASYVLAWVGSGSIKAIQFVWWGALAILMVGLPIRDGYHGRSPGKRLLGLRLVTPRGEGCGYARSVIRNLPLLIPVLDLVEAILVVTGKRRIGDRI